jgi:hypothetical protein
MEKEYIGFVYIWINKINGKKYIGCHIGDIDDGYIGSGTQFCKALKKYGIENFERKILYYENESTYNLYKEENRIINELNAVFSSEYYNLTNYDPSCPVEGKKYRISTDETKKKISIAAKNRPPASIETRQKMSETRKGKSTKLKGRKGHTKGAENGQFGRKWYNNGIIDATFLPGNEPKGWVLGRIRGINIGEKNGFFGKHHSDKTKETLSKANTGRLIGDKNPSKRLEVRELISKNTKGKRKKRKNENCS